MNSDDFGPKSPGKLIPVTAGSGVVDVAFDPAPLPPEFDWPVELWPLLADAESELARLDGTGKPLANPELLLTPLQEREALKSSSLEGTYTDPEGQMLFKLDPREPTSAADPANAYREVFNYSQALRQGDELLERLPLSNRLIRELHATLMGGVRGQNKRPGQFRQSQVHVGHPPRFVPPPAGNIQGCLKNLEEYMNPGDEPADELRPLVRAFVAHYQFETIHPFLDGNGRVGRLLLSLSIKEWCELSNQWLYMSAYFDANKDEYIRRLYEVSTVGAWTQWLEFCLEGVVVQARDAILRCESLLDLQADFRERIQTIRASNRLGAIVDQLFANPVVRIAPLAKAHDVTYPTAKSDAEKLESLGILTELHNADIRTFYAPDILHTIYE